MTFDINKNRCCRGREIPPVNAQWPVVGRGSGGGCQFLNLQLPPINEGCFKKYQRFKKKKK